VVSGNRIESGMSDGAIKADGYIGSWSVAENHAARRMRAWL